MSFKIRLALPLTVAILCASASTFAQDNVQVDSNLEYLESGRKERLDLYRPAKPEAGKRMPAFVWIHGGGWTGGTKDEARAKEICSTMAEAGWVAVSIDYRLGKGAWPQNLFDCKNAVRFLRANADKYGIDPQRIAVAGGSAGGHLALMVAYTNGKQDLEPTAPYADVSNEVRCVINLYGITNIQSRQKTDKQGNPSGEPNLGGALDVYGAKQTTDEVLRIGSPVNHVQPKSPPTLILHGLADSTVDYKQAEGLAKVLQENQVPHQLVLLENVGHTFAFQTWGKKKMDRDLRPVVFEFLAKYCN